MLKAFCVTSEYFVNGMDNIIQISEKKIEIFDKNRDLRFRYDNLKIRSAITVNDN